MGGMPGASRGRALITGASAGFGAALARRLAAQGWDLVLAARRADRLAALRQELVWAEGITVDCVAIDLADPDAAERLLDAAGPRVDLLVNGAGFGDYRPFLDAPWADHRRLLEVDLLALTELAHRFIERTRARGGRARLANVASMVAWYPMPGMALYGAGKAYVRSLSESLAAELAGTGISVSCVALGAVDTEFYQVAGIRPRRLYRPFVMSADRAARIALRGILRGRRVIQPGVVNRLLALTAWLLPGRLVGSTTRWLLGRPPPRPALPPGEA